MSSPTRGVLADREDAFLDAHILRPDDRPWGLGRFEMFDAPEIDDDDPDHDEKVAALLTAVAEAQSDAMGLFAARLAPLGMWVRHGNADGGEWEMLRCQCCGKERPP